MRFVDEYRDPTTARALVAQITSLAGDDSFKFMEVCGGHTHTIYRHGIEHVLPSNVELVHGPGCPVCVIPMGRVDDAMAVAAEPGVIFTSFGDMMRVPGSRGNLLQAKADGADVRFVYSPLDALRIASENPGRDVVFFAVGFETTAPSTALTLLEARGAPGDQLLRLLQSRDDRPSPARHPRVTGPPSGRFFGPGTRLDGGGPAALPLRAGRIRLAAGYGRLRAARHPPRHRHVAHADPRRALRGREPVRPRRARTTATCAPWPSWPRCSSCARTSRVRRGLGFIAQSGLKLRPEFAAFDAELRFPIPNVRVADPKACQCGEVLKGVIKPWECKVFGTACTPERPRSAPAWCPRRARARRITTSGGCIARPR